MSHFCKTRHGYQSDPKNGTCIFGRADLDSQETYTTQVNGSLKLRGIKMKVKEIDSKWGLAGS